MGIKEFIVILGIFLQNVSPTGRNVFEENSVAGNVGLHVVDFDSSKYEDIRGYMIGDEISINPDCDNRAVVVLHMIARKVLHGYAEVEYVYPKVLSKDFHTFETELATILLSFFFFKIDINENMKYIVDTLSTVNYTEEDMLMLTSLLVSKLNGFRVFK